MASLVEKINSFKKGYQIAEDAFHDILHKENPKYWPEIHETRINAIMKDTVIGQWEAFGYFTNIIKNMIAHPITTYRILNEKD